MATRNNNADHVLQEQMRSLLGKAPYVLRITERKNYTVPVLIISERITDTDEETGKTKATLKELGWIHGSNLRACLTPIGYMLSHMQDEDGRPYEPGRLLKGEITFRGNIPLDEGAGSKLALLFRLQGHVNDIARAELMAWRVERFSEEEAMYWLARIMIGSYGSRSLEWNKSGLRLMLAGQQKDKEAVEELLIRLRK